MKSPFWPRRAVFLTTWLAVLPALGLSACSDPPAKQPADVPLAEVSAVDAEPELPPSDAVPDELDPNGSDDSTSDDGSDNDTAATDAAVEQPSDLTKVFDNNAAPNPAAALVVLGEPAAVGPDVEIVYPPPEALAPADFAPITVQWTYSGPQPDFFLVRFASSQAEISMMGAPSGWTVPGGYAVTLSKSIWKALFAFDDGDDYLLRVVPVFLQGNQLAGKLVGSAPRAFHVTKEKTGGAIYYWNTAMQAVRVLEPGNLAAKSVPTPGGICTGCHSISPDGTTMAVSHMVGASFGSMSMSLVGAKTGAVPTWLHADAAKVLASSFTISAAFSEKYFTATDKRLVVPSTAGAGLGGVSLLAVDLLKGTSNKLVAGGDLGQQAFPTWSKQGTYVVYASASDVGQGFSGSQATALYRVPFNDGNGGQAAVIAGADEPGIFHYYPALSQDGQWIIYNRADPAGPACPSSGGGGPSSGGGATTYDNCNAELWAVPIGGGKAIRLDNANLGTDPLTNSWPTLGQVVGKYLWLTFSSRRDYGLLHKGSPAAPQIYVAAIDPQKLAKGEDGSFGALWLPGQDLGAGCHIARWSSPPRSE